MVHTDFLRFDRNVSVGATQRYALHCHTFHEVYYFVRGDVSYLVEGVSYVPAPHSLLLMASGVFHGMQVVSDAPYERYTLHFDAGWLPEALRGVLLAPFAADTVYHEGLEGAGLARWFEAIDACGAMPQALCDVALVARVSALLSEVCALTLDKRHDAGGEAVGEPLALSRQILAYINASLTEPLSLEGIAQQFFISRNHLCRVFARATGTTVGAYVRQKRLVLAGQLRAHGQSAAEAAANAGFGDYSTYYRAHCRLLGGPPTGEAARTAG